MEEENIIETSTEENQEQEQQEINYKEEYEKIIAGKEREEVLGSFRKVLDEKGFLLDEEKFSSEYEDYDNDTLKKFQNILGALSQKPSQFGFKIGVSGGSRNSYGSTATNKPTFQNYIDSKKE